MADLAKFMGRGRTHADVISDFAELSDQADQWQAFQAERAAQRAERVAREQQERRIAELEEEVAASSTRADRLGRDLRQANEGWGRARSEAASFRDAIHRSAYR
jgi:predicted RNase H-like nuclease (RuvC/YqgF family)